MGKHKHKKPKKQKNSKHKREKKHKKDKRRDRSSSESSSDSEGMWIEKRSYSDSDNDGNENKSIREPNDSVEREEWMNLPTSFMITSTTDRRLEKEHQKKLEKAKAIYNPRECSRELNPYWKDGGIGLPCFKKPCEGSDESNYYKKDSDRKENWRKKGSFTDKNFHNTFNSLNTPSNITQMNTLKSSEKELNALAAKLVKAEIMGNTKLISELKQKLEAARKDMAPFKSTTDDVILTHTDGKGHSIPLKLQSEYGEASTSKKRKIATHQDGQRVRYFADDDTYSLRDMFEQEKYSTVQDQNEQFIKMTMKVSKNEDLDDLFTDKIRNNESGSKTDKRNRHRAISQHEKISRSLDNCKHCVQSDSMLKHLMISIGETAYLSLPAFEPLTEGHCLIFPIRHVPCSTQLDENEWLDIMDIRRALAKYFNTKNEEVIFFEVAVFIRQFNHMVIECIPLPKEQGDLAPIYFKKAIDESETEWSQNKKLISLKGKDVRHAVPKELPYFFVSFGMDEGYAHIIEDEKYFPTNFAQEVVGGMLDLHHSKWRRPKYQNFKEQSERVLQFSKGWKDFDCTIK